MYIQVYFKTAIIINILERIKNAKAYQPCEQECPGTVREQTQPQ